MMDSGNRNRPTVKPEKEETPTALASNEPTYWEIQLIIEKLRTRVAKIESLIQQDRYATQGQLEKGLSGLKTLIISMLVPTLLAAIGIIVILLQKIPYK
ncbi:MAG: hypothetical protein M2R45_03808 [Verrucomicrobia subdivision 3 bacterium]|nr:hypothetical protein [Limisphaerales bacterium]MCS1416752.1 hypothetical protein [Limisphaerales bacterium]